MIVSKSFLLQFVVGVLTNICNCSRVALAAISLNMACYLTAIYASFKSNQVLQICSAFCGLFGVIIPAAYFGRSFPKKAADACKKIWVHLRNVIQTTPEGVLGETTEGTVFWNILEGVFFVSLIAGFVLCCIFLSN